VGGLWDRPNARRRDGARDVWLVYHDPVGSVDGFTLIWVWSTLLTLRQQGRRHRNIATATEALAALRRRTSGPLMLMAGTLFVILFQDRLVSRDQRL
jgi:hypothetical protein